MQRAFVVQFGAECDLAECFRGRAEHVRTGDSIRFETLDQLLTFLVDSIQREMRIATEEKR